MDIDIKEERDNEDIDNAYSDFRSDFRSENIEDLKNEFIEENDDEFNVYCIKEFNKYIDDLRLKHI